MEKVIFFDIDGTITGYKNSADDFLDAVIEMFVGEIAIARRISKSDAGELLRNFMNRELIWWDYPDFCDTFALDCATVRAAMRRIHREQLFVHQDAVELVKALYAENIPMAVLSNNPLCGCLFKLELAGLADSGGTKYFQRIFGTNIVRAMKNNSVVWSRIAGAIDVPLDRVAMVGDNYTEDGLIPLQCGVGNVFLLQRAEGAMDGASAKELHWTGNAIDVLDKILDFMK